MARHDAIIASFAAPALADVVAALVHTRERGHGLPLAPTMRLEYDLPATYVKIGEMMGMDWVKSVSLQTQDMSICSYPLLAADDMLVCEAMASRVPVVAVDGGVYPCVYLSLPEDPIPRLFQSERYEIPRRSFGNIADADLRGIWDGREFRSFRHAFELRRGLATHLSMDQLLGQEVRWAPAGPARRGETLMDQLQSGAPLPAQCRGCYKTCGL